ncbi:family 16 glycoside hydrolase [Rubinisphaera margarita]|uniref:family 16 glycoside hydrolase n=1 Tax=Rubinisphaera margarita TaxID=2909586 RepID=UPI001EE93EF2|nr:family 16 glycoside hydrolase [Rubinisphaera margarita]MCG6156754.1 DUF1080 domain-containing protein [Rubinisphaera margarita]
MNPRVFTAAAFCAFGFLATHLCGEERIETPLAEKGQSLLADDFERQELGQWKVILPSFRIEDGELVASQDRADHGSVGRVYLPMTNVVMSFRFNLVDSWGFNVVFDDKNYKGSHAGHIARVAITPKQIRLGDDKEGIMRNDIFAMRRDPKQKAAADKLLEGRGSNVKIDVAKGEWHEMTIELLGDEMRVSLNGKAIGHLQSSGLAHPTKESVHFTVNGREVRFDDVQIWEAKPAR